MERALADLVETGTDQSLVADAVRDAVLAEKLTAPERLVSHLDPSPRGTRATASHWPAICSNWQASAQWDGTEQIKAFLPSQAVRTGSHPEPF